MNKKKMVSYIFIIVGIVLIGVGIYEIIDGQSTEESIKYIPELPGQQFPAAGEQMTISVVAGHSNAIGVEGVGVSFTDTETGEGSICITDQYGRSETLLVCQDTYSITATYNGSTLTVNHIIECDELVGVLISEDDTIESIVFE